MNIPKYSLENQKIIYFFLAVMLIGGISVSYTHLACKLLMSRDYGMMSLLHEKYVDQGITHISIHHAKTAYCILCRNCIK